MDLCLVGPGLQAPEKYQGTKSIFVHPRLVPWYRYRTKNIVQNL